MPQHKFSDNFYQLAQGKTGASCDERYLKIYAQVLIPGQPIGLAMFKVAGYPSCNILNTLTLKLILDDLENNREKAESNPSKLVILRTFNPKLYEMRLNLFDNIYPNLHSYKYDLDNYVTESIERFKDDTELQNIIKKILGDKIVNLENDILQDKHAKLYTFNLKQLKKLRDKSVKSCLFVENLLNQIKIIYKKNISDEYQNILTKIIRNYYNK